MSAARYAEPTGQQTEEARALLFLAEARKALHTQEHIWDLTLELEVTYSIHNQRAYRIHATTKTGEVITGTEGHCVHPANGTAENTAWHLGISYRSATAKRRQATVDQESEGAAPVAPEAAHRATA